MDQFIQKLLTAAKESGIEAAEIYVSESDSFRAMCQHGEIANYTVNNSCGLSLRGIVNGRMGYSSTQAFDDEAIGMLVSGVKESASLIEDDSVEEIYKGDESYPVVDNYNPELDSVAEEDKLKLVLDIEKKTLAADEKIAAATHVMVSTASSSVRLVNSYGLDLYFKDNMAMAASGALAKDGDKVASGSFRKATRDFHELCADEVSRKAADEALFALNAAPIPSGIYRVIIEKGAMSSLLRVFSSVFSAENVQKGMSLLGGKEGEVIASEVVTLVDDPLLPGGPDSRGFDDEGVKSQTKNVVENGVLKTLLHNLKTARKAGVKSTGNARKNDYASPVHVAPSNFFFKPGEKDLDGLMADMGEGVVITDVSGLHAGANPSSGDFSLLAEGYTVKDGKKDQPVDRITVAGNFYRLLKNIRAVGSDLKFTGSSVCSPSIDAGELNIAGK